MSFPSVASLITADMRPTPFTQFRALLLAIYWFTVGQILEAWREQRAERKEHE